MNRREAKRLAALAAFTIIVASAGAARVYVLVKAPLALDGAIDFEVARGEPPQSVAARLQEQGIVRSAPVVLFLARSRGTDREIRFGTHRFEGSLTPAQVLDELIRPPQPTLRLTVTEGATWADVGAQLEREGIVSAASYRDAVCDPALLAELGTLKTANCAEGYLFPDTYNLAPGMTAGEIVALQRRRFEEVINELLERLPTNAENAILPPHRPDQPDWRLDAATRTVVVAKAVVLASIIEKEAGLDAERGLVSSVFHNRLRRGVRLQADPTVIYGILNTGASRDPAMLPRYVREPGPYNTYTTDGLPAGPICNPGRESLWAALQPDKTAFLYFVARGDGSHEFSSTLGAHNRAVARLRSARARSDRLTFAGPSPSIPNEQAAEVVAR